MNSGGRKKFNPLECGFLERVDKDGEVEYVYIDKHKVIGVLAYVYTEWIAYRIVHCFNHDTKDHVVFVGKIKSNDFAIELVKNIFY